MNFKFIIVILFALCAVSMANLHPEHPMAKGMTDSMRQIKDMSSVLDDQIAAAMKGIKMALEILPKLHTQQRTIARRNSTANCLAATAKVSAAVANVTCSTLVAASLNASSSASERTAKITAYCEGGCRTRVRTAINAITTNCTRGSWDVSRALDFNLRFTCAKEGSEYCANRLSEIFSTNSDKPGDLTEAQLNALCSPCSLRLLRIVSDRKDISTLAIRIALKALRGICTTVKGKRCALVLKGFETAFTTFQDKVKTDQKITADDIKPVVNIGCSPCVQALLARFAGIGIGRTDIRKFRALCRRRRKEFCITQVASSLADYLGKVDGVNPCKDIANTCTDGCRNMLKQMAKDGGCCWSLVVGLANNDRTVTLRDKIVQAARACAPEIPEPCKGNVRARYKLLYKNILKQWFDNNKESFKAKVIADVKFSLGPSFLVSNVVATNVQGSSDINVEMDVEGEENFADNIKEGDFECDQSCQVGFENFENPDDDISVTRSSENVVVTETSSATFVSFSAILLVVVAFVALF